jgi:adenosine deaminase
MPDQLLRAFIKGIPKAELHIHIGGTLEPEEMFEFARRNDRPLAFESVEALREAYRFNNLQEFLDLFHLGTNVLMKEGDYYDLTYNYISRAHADSVQHVEIFFDAQTHTQRGISFSTVITGMHRALQDAGRDFGVSGRLIPSFLRHLGEAAAFDTLKEALEFRDWIAAFGLASSELGYPPSDFSRIMNAVREEGFPVVAHAGEEGPPEYVRQAVDILHVARIDHGNRSLEDDALVKDLVERQIPLTLCPLSNLALKVITRMEDHPVKRMIDLGMMVTVNSDDPAYFGGYINDNYIAVAEALNLRRDDIVLLAKNSFRASFLTDEEINRHITAVDRYVAAFNHQG